MKECSFCHQVKPDTSIRIDPYAHEINEEDIDVEICDACYQERRDDI